jgi:hypothetical protein
MTAFYLLCGVVAAAWFFGLAVGLVALGWSVAIQKRLWPALVMSVLALIVGCLGLLFFHIRYSRTVNGSGWTFDSKWFFVAPLLLGGAALLLTLWKWNKTGLPAKGAGC